MYTDEVSSNEGSAAGIVLVIPQEETYTYTLCFQFTCSNNKAEYEALLAGLKMTKDMEVRHLKSYGDSMIVVNQVKGEYKTKEESMRQYLKQVTNTTLYFETFTIKQIPRSKNKQEGALSKMGSMAFSHLTKKVLVEVLEEISIGGKKVCWTKEREN